MYIYSLDKHHSSIFAETIASTRPKTITVTGSVAAIEYPEVVVDN